MCCNPDFDIRYFRHKSGFDVDGNRSDVEASESIAFDKNVFERVLAVNSFAASCQPSVTDVGGKNVLKL